MSFTDQKPFMVTEKMVGIKHWGNARHLNCKLCGHRFKAGEVCRWVFANDKGGNGSGNFMTCQSCDGPDVLERGRASYAEAQRLAKQWGIFGSDWQEH